MQTILPSEFKRQMVLLLEGAPMSSRICTPAAPPRPDTTPHPLRHLTTGRLIDRVFAENERVAVAPLETAA